MHEIGVRSRDVYELILPAVDMFEDGTDLVVIMDMPGFEKDKIKTRLTENFLTVSATRERAERDGVIYWEQRPLRVNKRIPLPVKVETGEEEITAKYENGELTVRLPIKGINRVTVK